MAVPKKRTSISKKIIRNTFWKKRGYWTRLKAFSLAQSIFTGNSKSFFCNKYKR
uniref:Large ribosomal subunit protein bL32c n=1 Tax=Millettia stuhlmannii TaxID=1237622 RepID=A0A8F3ISI6_9FABA|nr:ribosomal protein L32 [Millettia stuhlmannii]